jgi:ubiquitin-conjugating enzyme E2 variant
MMTLFQILAAWLLADLVTGAIHWFEDKFMDAKSLNFLAAEVAADNDLHHQKPTAMTLNSGWENMRSGAAVGWPLAAGLWWFGFPLWVWLTPFFAAFGNLVHRFAHMPEHRVPRFVRGMQEFGLFISYDHHDQHHRSMKRLIPKHEAGFKFCPMTDWVNPLVDRIGLWTFLERSFRWLGLKPIAERKSDAR